MIFEVVEGSNPNPVTLVKLKNGAVIARCATPAKDTMKPYFFDDEVNQGAIKLRNPFYLDTESDSNWTPERS